MTRSRMRFGVDRLALAVLVLVGSVHGAEARCKVVGSSVGGVMMERAGGLVGYRLTVRDARWSVEGFGWHANALIECNGCASGEVAQGTLWLDAATVETVPTQAQLREFGQLVSAMWFSGMGAVSLRTEGHQERFAWGTLTGYAQRLATLRQRNGKRSAMVVWATDGCLVLRLFAREQETVRPLSTRRALAALVKGLTIERMAAVSP